MSDTPNTGRRWLRWRLAGASLITTTTAAIMLASATPAAAHHGWDGFDTDHLIYVAGTVASDGSWGEPHSYFEVNLDSDLPADTPELAIPEELQDPEDSVRVNAALSYGGTEEGLEVIIAPPAWSSRWGLDRALAVGERFQGVGYVNRTDNGLFRPVVFWYGDDQVPVNQVLGNTLPVRAPLPAGVVPLGGSTAEPPPTAVTAPDPLETTASSTDPGQLADGVTPSREDSTGTGAVWTVFGLVVVAAAVGGFLYVRRRARTS